MNPICDCSGSRSEIIFVQVHDKTNLNHRRPGVFHGIEGLGITSIARL